MLRCSLLLWAVRIFRLLGGLLFWWLQSTLHDVIHAESCYVMDHRRALDLVDGLTHLLVAELLSRFLERYGVCCRQRTEDA